MPKRVTPRGESAPPPEPNVASAQIKKKAAKKSSTPRTSSKPGTRYIRNLHGIDARVTLDTGRRIELKPRGQVEDLAPVSKDEQEDSKFLINIGVTFEVITTAEARDIISKQVTNAQAPRPRHLLELLTNEKGEPYQQADVHVDPTQEEQGFVVATVEDAADGRYSENNTQVVRREGPPEQVNVPGSVGNPLPDIPSDVRAEDVREFIAWRDAQRLREGLGKPVMEAPKRIEE